MDFIGFLWILVWSGMFSSPSSVQFPVSLMQPVAFFQGTRALYPVLAAYLCLIWIFFSQKRLMPPLKTPLGAIFYYCLVGMTASMFLSPSKYTALYWGAVYVSPILVMWISLNHANAMAYLRKLIYLNYIIAIGIVISLLPEAFRMDISTPPFGRTYDLPFNLGGIRVNGAGRFALVAIIVSFVRLISQKEKKRYLWLPLILSSLFLIIQTQSRTALLGLSVAGILFIYLKGLDRRLLFVGPTVAFVIWLSGYKWRAQGQIEKLLYLSGREYTWKKGIELFKESPIFGSGFHADRLLLDSQHMHNSYFHSMVQSGALGTIFFLGAMIGIWALIFRSNLLKKVRYVEGRDQTLLIESVLILGFLTTRSFFESTAAFYGVDLLLFIPAMTYIYLWIRTNAAAQQSDQQLEK